jgi:hypothetical protein
MEEQISPSQIPFEVRQPSTPIPGTITPEQLEMMKARAREIAVRTSLEQQQQQALQSSGFPLTATKPEVVYVRRNFTVAELILVVFLACGLVTTVQFGWNFATSVLPRIEVNIK